MLTLFHAPNSRSSRIVTLIDEMGIADRITVQTVNIARMDGSGAADPANLHPEGKTPALLHDGTLITESGAIMLYLTSLFPDSSLAPKIGEAEYGAYLTWMVWYGSVMEPVLIHSYAGLSHPALERTYRGTKEVNARLCAALERGPWLMGTRFTAADILCHSPYAWLKDATPDEPLIRGWVERCMARPARTRTLNADAALMAS